MISAQAPSLTPEALRRLTCRPGQETALACRSERRQGGCGARVLVADHRQPVSPFSAHETGTISSASRPDAIAAAPGVASEGEGVRSARPEPKSRATFSAVSGIASDAVSAASAG